MADERGVGSAKASRRRERKKAGKLLARRKKEFSFRGYSLDDLKKMTIEELIPLLPSRARRTLRRGLSKEAQKFWDAVRRGNKDIIETHCRDAIVLPELVGRKVGVHKGNEFKIVEIIPEMIGHYLGEFAMTRKFIKHAGPGVGATRSSKFMPLK
ncbi:MAG: 30S ribosomal protein S19 [Thermoplasmatota archaeon]